MPRRRVVYLFFFVKWINQIAGRPKSCVLFECSTLDFRFMKYATRERKNGRVPFIDPFATNPCRQVYGKSEVLNIFLPR